MRLKKIKICFQSLEDIIDDINGALYEGKEISQKRKDEILFDSPETFKRMVGQNKLELLRLISRYKPQSIYQLEKLTNRKYPHVLADCKLLQILRFIKLTSTKGAKKQLKPELTFDYDIIYLDSEMGGVFPISEKSEKLLLEVG